MQQNPNLGAGLDDAIAGWNSVLAGSGIQFDRNTSSCDIEIVGSDRNFWTAERDPATGQATGDGGTLEIDVEHAEDWNIAEATSLFGHEIGHGLGLGDTSFSCPQQDSIMTPTSELGPGNSVGLQPDSL
ncbi:MAG TPA: hypothetical protein VNN18_03040 [Candidatus Xenobia bacterium]|nr:hypothetical protein [Candidatus Xenobia bacterium]